MKINFCKYILLTLLTTAPHSLFSAPALLPQENTQEDLFCEPGACYFIPPRNWGKIDNQYLLQEVKIMVKGHPKEQNHIPPSINLALESTHLSTEEYLKAIEISNPSDSKRKWSKIGIINTQAGPMVLTQLDLTSKWGEVRMLQAIMVKNKQAYVLTATAQASEFSEFSKEFYESIQSFTINKNIYQLIPDKNKRKELKKITKNAKKVWQEELQNAMHEHPEYSKDVLSKMVFEGDKFQTLVWKPLEQTLSTSYSWMGSTWINKFLHIFKSELNYCE